MTFGTKVENAIYTAGQPSEVEFTGLKRSGFQRVIDLRPHSEARGFDEKKAATLQNLTYVCLPVSSEADLTLANVKQLDALLSDPAAPMTLVHCGSGNRVGALFALRAAWLKGATPEAALAVGRSAGLKGLESAIRSALSNRATGLGTQEK